MDVLEQTGLSVLNAGRLNSRQASKCTLCGTRMMNMMVRWKKHATKCLLKSKGSNTAKPSLMMQVSVSNATQPTPFLLQINAAAELHRKRLCDTYLITYWVYKNKMSFTTGDKMKEVSHLYHPRSCELSLLLGYVVLFDYVSFLFACVLSYSVALTARTRLWWKS